MPNFWTYPKKTFFEFFSSVFWGLSTGTKCEKLNFYSSNILNSPLVSVKSPQKIEEKNSKKFFLGICTGLNT
jgi:hypothetical protein